MVLLPAPLVAFVLPLLPHAPRTVLRQEDLVSLPLSVRCCFGVLHTLLKANHDMKSAVYILLKILDATLQKEFLYPSDAERHIGLSREFVSLKLLRETCKDLAGTASASQVSPSLVKEMSLPW